MQANYSLDPSFLSPFLVLTFSLLPLSLRSSRFSRPPPSPAHLVGTCQLRAVEHVAPGHHKVVVRGEHRAAQALGRRGLAAVAM